MITPIWTMKISEIVERHEDLLVSADDIKELAKNERAKAISEFAEAIKYEFGSDDIHETVDEIATKLKGE